MEKKNLGVIFGGKSTENEVSVQSAKYIMNNLNSEKYNIFPIYIDKQGIWYKCSKLPYDFEFGKEIIEKEKITNVIEYIKKLDIAFPVLHGLYGEDGTIQGLFELLNIKYVGCGVLASSVGMDKVYAKILFQKANIPQAKYIYIKAINDKYSYIEEDFKEEKINLQEIAEKVFDKIGYPVFVKPSNSGSSVGVRKAENDKELIESIKYATNFDKKILIEEEILGKEVECAVLGNDTVLASPVGEIKAADKFYSFDAKYKNKKSKTLIPAEISSSISDEIRKQAIKAFKCIDGKGLARVDFFIQEETNKIYINEINTMPGFTDISMYPKLFEHYGIKYSDLLDRLVNLAES